MDKTAKKVKIGFVGGGSYGWAPALIRDIISAPNLEDAEFRLYDTNLAAAELITRLGKKLAADWNKPAIFIPTNNIKRAFQGVDFIIICISTGGFDSMQHDLKIPEKYGIFQTVGDTVGPGGWARGLRNIPVFLKIAKAIREYCPQAVILNYTNPMSTLTRTLCENTRQSVVGLCHGVFGCYEILKLIFDLKSEKEIKVNFGGVNHFFWILDLKINGRDGYQMLRQKLRGRNLNTLIREVSKEAGESLVAAELFEEYGYLPYLGDRHISEFFSHYLAPNQKNLKLYHLHRTSIAERRRGKAQQLNWVKKVLAGKEKMDPAPSRESAAMIMSCIIGGEEFVDVTNLPNKGQIPNLPIGAIVETMGIVNQLGFTPLQVGPLPQAVLNLVLPHAVNQQFILEAGTTGNWDIAFKALISDPLCSHLSIPQIKKMGYELLKANRKYLPQFTHF